MDKFEYEVEWHREGIRKRKKRFARLSMAERYFLLLTSPEPWKVQGNDPDDHWCCSGQECGCRGETYREQSDNMRACMPKLLYAKINKRAIGDWNLVQQIEYHDAPSATTEPL